MLYTWTYIDAFYATLVHNAIVYTAYCNCDLSLSLSLSLSLFLPPSLSLHFPLSLVPANPKAVQQSIITPKVHMLGENAACIAYIRLVQSADK